MRENKPKVKLFTVDIERTKCETEQSALNYFMAWRKKYGYNEKVKVLGVKNKFVWTIHYTLEKD